MAWFGFQGNPGVGLIKQVELGKQGDMKIFSFHSMFENFHNGEELLWGSSENTLRPVTESHVGLEENNLEASPKEGLTDVK